MKRSHSLRSLLCLALVAFCLPAQNAEAQQATASRQKGLLIVAPQQFAPALADYARYKQKQLPTDLVSLEQILVSSSGVDDPERLKRYLYKAWRSRNIGYVLLVGDADIMPVRYMVLDRVTPAAFDYAFYPSDLYYSDLAKQDGSFEDWNAHKDGFHAGYFGEVRGEKNKQDPINYDAIDYRPEIAVGRWPVDTLDEVRTVVTKTITYETGIVKGAKPGMRSMGLFAVGGWVDSRAQMDRWAAMMPGGWKVEKRYYADSGRNDGTPAPNEKNLYDLLNQGVGLLCHAGHGSDDTWAGCCAVWNLNRVKNADRLPVMISAGCSTARFATLPPYEPYKDVFGKDHAGSNSGEVFTAPPPPPAPYQTGKYNPTGLGEQLLRRGPDGAVAYIGCNTGSQPCALTLEEGFVNAVAHAKQPRLGDCWNQAIVYYYDHEHLASLTPNADWYPPSIFFQGMKYMVFGDPSLLLPTPKP
jgi:hypothetical protein